uniref:NADH-ubiquinone oxidoreductase chain 4L n=1 Tax=Sadoletus valdezi TaxID=2813444 RepID=A0A8T9ZWW9_9HEMI|nr:NADH dehydrogenase subunit 4L [Sadoletus valdezi]
MYMDLFFILMFISGLLVFISTRNHLLTTLFSLEYLVLLLFLMFFTYLLSYGFELYFILIFLVFSVCEGSLGLGILVNIVRSHGNDYLSSMNVLSW